MTWDDRWNQTLIELAEIDKELRPIFDIKDDKEREIALKPIRERCVAIHYRRMDLVDELRKNS